MEYMKQNLQEIIEKFSVDGEFVSATPCGNGHINDTFSVRMNINGKMLHYLVQSVNLYVFPEVEKLMENMMRVTDHVYKILKDIPGADPERETRRIIPTVDGFPGFVDEKNHYWRVFTFIENAYTIDVVESPHQAYQAAKAFGTFQKYLRDLPGTRLFDTIPDFHHTPKRYQALEKAIDNCQSNQIQFSNSNGRNFSWFRICNYYWFDFRFISLISCFLNSPTLNPVNGMARVKNLATSLSQPSSSSVACLIFLISSLFQITALSFIINSSSGLLIIFEAVLNNLLLKSIAACFAAEVAI